MLASMWDNLPLLLPGAWNTISVSVLSMAISLAIAFVVGLTRLSKNRAVDFLSLAYIEVWRGVPMIITILFTYFALPRLLRGIFRVDLDSFTAMLVACVLWTSANAAEVVRGAVQAIPFGQGEAAEALGMSYLQRMRLVIMPQAVMIMLPPMIGIFNLLLQGTAIGFMIEYRELVRVGQITIERLVMAGNRNASIEIYTLIMILYFVMCYPLSKLSAHFERKLAAGRPAVH